MAKYYLNISNDTYEITAWGTCPAYSSDTFLYETTEEVYNAINEDKLQYIYDPTTETVILNPNYEQQVEERKRKELDLLSLTPADVERALYKAKEMDFEDLKVLIHRELPNIDMKALSIEFRAKDFYRGAVANGVRLFDVVGLLLGYSSDDMDYLFLHKELPNQNF